MVWGHQKVWTGPVRNRPKKKISALRTAWQVNMQVQYVPVKYGNVVKAIFFRLLWIFFMNKDNLYYATEFIQRRGQIHLHFQKAKQVWDGRDWDWDWPINIKGTSPIMHTQNLFLYVYEQNPKQWRSEGGIWHHQRCHGCSNLCLLNFLRRLQWCQERLLQTKQTYI